PRQDSDRRPARGHPRPGLHARARARGLARGRDRCAAHQGPVPHLRRAASVRARGPAAPGRHDAARAVRARGAAPLPPPARTPGAGARRRRPRGRPGDARGRARGDRRRDRGRARRADGGGGRIGRNRISRLDTATRAGVGCAAGSRRAPMRLRLSLLASVTVLALAAAPAARAQVDACPAPVGAACALWAFPAFVPEILAGGESGAALLAGVRGLSRDAVPLVPLAVDPGDGPPTGSLSARLSASQQALLGCGPWWGTPCEASGVNLLGAEASVILQGWFGGEGVYVPGYPGTIGFPPPIGFVPPDRNPAAPPGTVSLPSRPALPPIVEPLPSGWPRTEMAVLSYNFQLLLVAFSGGPNADPARPGHFDRSDPYA